MFTGIIEAKGTVIDILKEESNVHFTVQSVISHELKPDQSVAHDGVCLTVTQTLNNTHQVTAIAETLKKTNLNEWQIGHVVNLERAIKANDRLDGHIVQGHVDTTAICIAIKEENGSHTYTFQYPESFANLIIEKGSICINGISLTAFNVSQNQCSVAIIPFTMQLTNIENIQVGTNVNFEFDILGKYVARHHFLLSV